MEIYIRKANKKDNHELEKLSAEVQQKHAKERPDQHRFKSVTFEEVYKTNIYANSQFGVFVAVTKEGKIVGYIITRIMKHEPHFEGQQAYAYLYLHEIAVAGDYKKQNIGKKLINYAQNFAKENKAQSIELGVWEFNQTAIKFYEKLGFKTKIRKMEIKL